MDALTIDQVVEGLSEDLKSYLQAQYHIRDEDILRERRALFDADATIAQIPFLEATPSYRQVDQLIGEMDLPENTKQLLEKIASAETGIYPKPYVHQAVALTEFINRGQNILAATGTGSGKTEIFLLAILATLAEEAALGKGVTGKFGCRALVLYPMNALVSDQIARLRLLFGNTEAKRALAELRGRIVQFGMYTGRTPFPGVFPSAQNNKRFPELFKSRFKPTLSDADYLQALKERGKWPAKDIEAFFGQEGTRWANRLITGSDDAELMTRHEMQRTCPDILVTNYSMLEYMLVRPIERDIFTQTKNWLASDQRTYFTVVLDEAHMYRGAIGAEVSFLLRRLLDRLDIPRERVRFILTTASVGESSEDRELALQFACDITSLPIEKKDQFSYVTGTKEDVGEGRPATVEETKALVRANIRQYQGKPETSEDFTSAIRVLCTDLQLLNAFTDETEDDLYRAFRKFPPAALLIKTISGSATPLTDVESAIFPNASTEDAKEALDSLLRVCNMAREKRSGKVLLPARIHLFFRGVSGLYCCANPGCNQKRDSHETPLLGRMYSEPTVSCLCGGRAFEIYSHRDCGATYLIGYVSEKVARPDFMWHEPTTPVSPDSASRPEALIRQQFLVSAEEPAFDGWIPCWLQVTSGKIVWDDPDDEAWLDLYAADDTVRENVAFQGRLFGKCPACGKIAQRNSDEPSKIMDLATKGEQPFSQLVKRQVFSQVDDIEKDPAKFPNRGKKTLIFSDGRQKAARLAKAIPEEVEADTLRELLALGLKLYTAKRQNEISITKIYLLFIAACSEARILPYFGQDREIVKRAIDSYRNFYLSDIKDWYSMSGDVAPLSFITGLYRQACGGLYSLTFIAAGGVWPMAIGMRMLSSKLADYSPNDLEPLAALWIQDLARDIAFSNDVLKHNQRESIQGFRGGRASYAHTGKFRRETSKLLLQMGFDVGKLENNLREVFGINDTEGTGMFLDPAKLSLSLDLEREWFSCKKCKTLSMVEIRGRCAGCGSTSVTSLNPDSDPYVRTRKGFWRTPMREVVEGRRLPRLLNAEEHTAQLTHSDAASGPGVIEEYELRFQDILRENETPVDILSCTTTMEVGINIGSLVSVSLRNVPPQRENYQQRAGRAGRRGSAISTVVTFCQGNPHDNYYYSNVEKIVSGPPRQLKVKTDNPKIARRHIHAFLLQDYFNQGNQQTLNPNILSSLGSLAGFYDSNESLSCANFSTWIEQNSATISARIGKWVGTLKDIDDVLAWVDQTVEHFCTDLTTLKLSAAKIVAIEEALPDDEKTTLLAFLLRESLLPSYAFPTNLSSFLVEEVDNVRLNTKYNPTQSAIRALSEYAPGKVITIDKNDYISSAVTANAAKDDRERASTLFTNPHRKPYVFCSEPSCYYVEDVGYDDAQHREKLPCPLCSIGSLRVMELISPEVYLPERGKSITSLDDDPEFSRATPAQFPVPVHQASDSIRDEAIISERLTAFRKEQAELIVVNKGDPDTQLGFDICRKCGTAHLVTPGKRPKANHKTPYYVQAKAGSYPQSVPCSGDFGNVFLGHRFSTDLVILRARLGVPLSQTAHGQGAEFLALQAGLQTIAEALPLAAAKHFDVDSSEFSSGFRFVQQGIEGERLLAEVYMFDTLSGGAGYSHQLAEAMEGLLRNDVEEILKCTEEIDGGCDRSCHNCLRHYHNQYFHNSLDRRIGRELLRFLLDGAPLENPIKHKQTQLLLGLADMLRFDGINVETDVEVEGVSVPILAINDNRKVAIDVVHPLVTETHRDGLTVQLDGSAAVRPLSLNAFYLSRNLPSCFLEVKRWLGE